MLPLFYHNFIPTQSSNIYGPRMQRNEDSLSHSQFSKFPEEIMRLILDIFAQTHTHERSILLVCKKIYFLGFLSFHKAITSDFFLKTICG